MDQAVRFDEAVTKSHSSSRFLFMTLTQFMDAIQPAYDDSRSGRAFNGCIRNRGYETRVLRLESIADRLLIRSRYWRFPRSGMVSFDQLRLGLDAVSLLDRLHHSHGCVCSRLMSG